MFITILFIIILIALIFFTCLCIWYQTWSRYGKLLNAFPGPRIIPLFGNVLSYSLKPDILFLQIRAICEQYTETWRGWSLCIGSLQIVTANDAEIILSDAKPFNKGLIYEFFVPWLRSGLLVSKGSKWFKRRKMLTPGFHFNILKKFVEVFGDNAEILIQELKEESKKEQTNVVPLMTTFTLASICETAMGIKLNRNDKLQAEYIESVHKVARHLLKRGLSPWLYLDFIYRLSSAYSKFSKLIKFLHKFTANIIKEREERFKETDVVNLDEINEEYGIKKKRLAMLDLLISIKLKTGEIDDDGIREEVDTFIFAGHDTSAVSACSTLLLLANHKDIQEKIIKEMDEIFCGSNRPATYDDLQNMKYLERCIKESLRLYPSVPFISRVLFKDTQLTHHMAPAFTVVFLHIYNIHRDPKIYPDPEKFDPDRFLPENIKGRSNAAYIPFSIGPRNCIGQRFAMLELKCIISSILRNFTLEPIDSQKDLTFIVDLVLRPKGSVNIKFVPRNLDPL